jgi:hypothetical protein
MKKINPIKPDKTQQNRQKTAIFREIYDWSSVSWDCGQPSLACRLN